MKQPQSVTDLPESPEDEHRRRVFQYVLAMSIRVVCVLACVWVRGWWLLIPALGAVVLPYIAVVLANVGHRRRSPVRRPGSQALSIEADPTPQRELPAAIGPAVDDERRP